MSAVWQLFVFCLQDKKDNEYPCQLCDKTFSSLFSVKTHIYVAHPAIFRTEQSAKKGLGVVKKSRKLTTTSQKRPWCRPCRRRFPNRSEYAGGESENSDSRQDDTAACVGTEKKNTSVRSRTDLLR